MNLSAHIVAYAFLLWRDFFLDYSCSEWSGIPFFVLSIRSLFGVKRWTRDLFLFFFSRYDY